jgi:hypothetical protein
MSLPSSGNGAIVVASSSSTIGVDGNIIDFNVVGSDLSGEKGEEGVHYDVSKARV